LLAAALPALQAGRVSPVESLRRLPPPVRCHRRRSQVAAGLGLLACGLGYLAVSQLPSRLGGYGAMVLLLLAGLLMTPPLALAAARALQPAARRLLGPSARLALDNLVRAPGRTGLVITTLAAGTALFVQTSGFIASNEKAIAGWVEHSLTGDLFVTSGGPLSVSGQNLPMAPGILRRLEEACPEAQVVPIRFRYLDWQRGGRPSRVLLCAVDAERYYAANKDRSPALPDLDLYRRLAEPGTALVSRNFAALYGVRAGDPLTLPGSEGPVRLRVLGTVDDYTCSRGTVLVDRRRYGEQFDAHLIDSFTLYLPSGADVESVRQRLQVSALGGEQAFCLLTRDALRGHILGMVLGLYRLAYAQEVMVAVVSILAIVTALLLSILQRRRELGLLRAVGATPTQVARSVVAEAVFMGVIGTAAGLAVGAPLEWYTVRVLLFAETGTLLPLRFPWASAGAVFCLLLLGAAVASLGPALRAGRGPVAEAINWGP
jgi:putative ABC transport system permease protein